MSTTFDLSAEAWGLMRELGQGQPAGLAAIARETGLAMAPLRALIVLPLSERPPSGSRSGPADSPTPEPISMRQLAAALGCDNSYVTALVDALEQRALAVRRQLPSDRRVKVIELTAAGDALARRARAADATPPPCFAELSRTELTILRDLLLRLSPAEPGAPAGGAQPGSR